MSNERPMGPLRKIEQACDFLGVSRSQLYALMDRGELSYVKLPGTGIAAKSRRIPQAALDSFVQKCLVGAA
jgi:excisionase family DNA binding protein